MSYYPTGQPTHSQTHFTTQPTVPINVPHRDRQSRPRASTTQATSYEYQEQHANIPYGSHQSQTGALPVPQPHRQSLSTRPHSISPHTSSRVDYPEQGFPSSYNGPSHAQMGYSGEYESGGFLTAMPVDSGFPESAGGAISMQRSTSGGHYRDGSVGSSVRRSPTAHTTTLYGPTGSVVRRSPSQPPSALRSPAHSSVRRSPPTHSSTLYAPTIDSGHRSPSEPSSVLYAPAGYSSTVHPRQSRSQSQSQQPAYYPSGGAQVGFDPTPQYVDGSQYTVPLDHGANASDGRYQSAGPVTHHVPGTIAPEPPYRDIHPQERVAGSQNRGGYEYDDLNENEHLPKGPGHVPAQGRSHTCRMPGCNRAMYFDRRFNEFWEWCSTQHIHEALGRGMEKVCKRCAVWPRKYGYRYCGGDACNKRGVPL